MSLPSSALCAQHISDIIERGVREHPELSVGSNSDSVEVRSVGNSQVLHETALVEAFNLKVRGRARPWARRGGWAAQSLRHRPPSRAR